MVAIGTDYGVYTAEAENARGWTRVSAAQPSTCLKLTLLVYTNVTGDADCGP